MKSTANWESLEDRVAGRDAEYRGLIVKPFIATVRRQGGDSPGANVIRDLFDGLIDRSVQLPGLDHGQEELVVGSLDLNIGLCLPSEELVGRLPAAPAELAAPQRAYLSNVCVAGAARRRGVALALVRAALGAGAAAGVCHAYVHVAASNEAAVRLYRERCGFAHEQQETESFARSRSRPRRLLLHRVLTAC